MKKIIRILILSISLLILNSCSRVVYADSIKCIDMGENLKAVLNEKTEYTQFDRSHPDITLDIDGEYDDFYAVYSTDTSDIDEIGIFHSKSKDDAEDIAEECREYIDDMKENSKSFISSYAPNELPKLENATVRRFGNYVVYTVLDGDTADAVFESIKETLKK